MRFTVSSSALSSKLNMLAKVIGSKNSLPILDCFLFQVANGEMSITASDSDNVIKSTLALTDHDGEGEFCVPNRVILDALKELPEQPLHFDVDAAGEAVAIKIVYQNGLYNFTGQSAEEYPRTQSMNDACTTVSLPTEMLINNISRSLFATASDELRPVMNGIYFDLTADALAIVASDGHKLVRSKNFTIKSESPSAFNLPKKPASLLKNILSKDGDAIIKFDDRSAEIQFTDGVMRCRLIDGRYPNYNSVIPNNPNEVTVDRRGLQSALRRVLPFASESSQLIRFHIESGRFEVSSEDIDFSTSAKEQLSCEYNGSPISIGFKGSSLMEILSNLTSDNIIIQLADPSRAGIIVPAEQPENEDILMLIMPMLLND